MRKRVAILLVAVLTCAATASAQAPQGSGGQQSGTTATQAPAQPKAAATGEDTRRATTTFMGDTGLWFVPTGEVLPAKKWSASGYFVNFDYTEGFTDVSNWPITFGFGVGDRAEVFGSWSLLRRIDRDIRPIFVPGQPTAGGIVNEYPFVRTGWSGNNLGDLWVGTKINLLSQYRQQPVAFGIRGMIKLPTAGGESNGVGTGKADVAIDAVLSKEVNQRVELSGFGGMIFRGKPDGIDISNGFRWGFGAGVPTRANLRFTFEVHGERYTDTSVAITRSLVADDLSVPPAVATLDNPFHFSLGLTWTGRNGFFAGAGAPARL
jgi:hypothetical protein